MFFQHKKWHVETSQYFTDLFQLKFWLEIKLAIGATLDIGQNTSVSNSHGINFGY